MDREALVYSSDIYMTNVHIMCFKCYIDVFHAHVQCVYSGTSEERTLWEQHFCPLFGGCPLLGGCLIFALYPS